MLKAALWYAKKKNFCVIPIRNDGSKKALIKWLPYQKTKSTEKEIKEWWAKWPDANIGIVTGKISSLTVFDFDWHKMTQDQLADAKNDFPVVATPTVISPRLGEHRYFEYAEEVPNKSGVGAHIDTRNDGGYIIAPPSKNGSGSYQWQDKAKINDMSLRQVPPRYLKIINALNNSFFLGNTTKKEVISNTRAREELTTIDHKFFEEGNRDQALFHIAHHLIKGKMPEQRVKYILSLIAEKICNPPFPQKEIVAKIKSALQRSEKQNINLAAEVRDWIMTTDGHFLTTDVHRELQLTTRQEKRAAVMEILRLVDQGIIVKFGEKRGCYRMVDAKDDLVDIAKVDEGERISIRLPFGMEQFVDLMPKDLIVFAGVPNSGKTALLLETVRLNMKRFECFYFSSEMGKQNCKRRLKKYTGDVKWTFKISDSFSNYIDIIKPDGLNFIDYLEAKEGEYYKIPSMLSEIQRKLTTGLAIVALQKNPEKDYGVGGAQTTAKPAIFLAIDTEYPHNILKIVKAKNFRDENPNGYIIKFKIIGGINIMPSGVWGPEYD